MTTKTTREHPPITQLPVHTYQFHTFPAEKTLHFIREFNAHVKHLDDQSSTDPLQAQMAHALTTLQQLYRLTPYRFDKVNHPDDYGLGIYLLKSIISLLNTRLGNHDTTVRLQRLGYLLLDKLYTFSYDDLLDSAFLYQWLLWKRLTPRHSSSNKGFSLSSEELHHYFIKNQQKIFEYMAFEMHRDKEEIDPLQHPDAIAFFRYHQALDAFET